MSYNPESYFSMIDELQQLTLKGDNLRDAIRKELKDIFRIVSPIGAVIPSHISNKFRAQHNINHLNRALSELMTEHHGWSSTTLDCAMKAHFPHSRVFWGFNYLPQVSHRSPIVYRGIHNLEQFLETYSIIITGTPDVVVFGVKSKPNSARFLY